MNNSQENIHTAAEQYAHPKTINEYSNQRAYGPLLDTVFRLRYQSYSTEGFIKANDSKLFFDEFDDKPNCTSYLTFYKESYKEGHREHYQERAIASIRSCMYTPGSDQTIPIMEVFEKEIDNSIGLDNTMLEINKFVIAPHFQRRGGITARFMVYANVVNAALDQGAKYLVAAVREEHIQYNHSMFGFELASEPRSYPHLKFKTALMVCDDIERVRRRLDKKLGKRKVFNDSPLSYGVC
ncbi:N-acyl amino acid synthase FeeM domain-containing protein [Agarilytica rhodophyticola]|uniref:N-acyl amino acid synthase FeeM domain-containing protein n=1 Tax=Agarilytica rhodophyticola TaxID=1737490 RepID=UPI000B344485|nr:hypothetical protein [Agarilytica rhodophyticola]